MENIASILGTLTGLVTVVWTFIDKNNDRKHQISKDAYQKIFNRKLLIYRDIYDILNEYQQKIKSEKNISEYNEYRLEMEALEKIFDKIKEQFFILSAEIESHYKKLYLEYKTANNAYYKEYGSFHMDPHGNMDFYYNEIKREFYDKNQQNIKNFLNTIEKEIQKERDKINQFHK